MAKVFDIHAKKDQIEALARHHGAMNIRLFGSFARGEERLESDTVYLLHIREGYPRPSKQDNEVAGV